MCVGASVPLLARSGPGLFLLQHKDLPALLMGSMTQGRALLCAHPFGSTPSCSPLGIGEHWGIGKKRNKEMNKGAPTRRGPRRKGGLGREGGKEGRVVELFVDALSVWFPLSAYGPCSLSLPSVDRIIQPKFRTHDTERRKKNRDKREEPPHSLPFPFTHSDFLTTMPTMPLVRAMRW